MTEGPGIQLYDENGQLKDQAAVVTPAAPGGESGTVSVQLFAGHPDDGELKAEAEIK